MPSRLAERCRSVEMEPRCRPCRLLCSALGTSSCHAMYQNPVLFPQISNRESWLQTVQIADDDTGDLIALTDDDNNPLYAITLEIQPPRLPGGAGDFGGYGTNPWYDTSGGPIISATLADYITIV